MTTIILNPTHTKVGKTITITGNAFTPNATPVVFTFGGSPIIPTNAPISVASDGTFSATIVIPTSIQGNHTINANDGTVNANATFTTDPGITVNLVTQKVGSPVNIIGTGFASTSAITLTIGGSDVTPTSHTTNSTGGFTFNNVLIPSITSGLKTISATDASTNNATTTITVYQTTKSLILGSSGLGGGDKTFTQLYVAINVKKNKVKKTLALLKSQGLVTLTGSFFTGTWHKV